MKNTIALITLLLPVFLISQIPVTDAASGALLTKSNITQTASLKVLTKLIATQEKIIANQGKIIKLMEEQNRTLKHTDDLKTEEIEAYKKAPESIIVDYQLYDLENVKDDIVSTAKDFVKVIQKSKHLKSSDVRFYEDKTLELVEGTVMAWRQTKKLLSSNDKIIPANERQELLQTTIADIKKNIAKIKSFKRELSIVSLRRKANDRMFGNK